MDFVREILGNDYYFHHSISDNANTSLFKLHTHNAFEIYLFLEGDGSFITEGNYYKLEPWDLLFIKPGEFHRISIENNMSYERKVIRFDYSFLKTTDPENLLILPYTNKLANFNIIQGSKVIETSIPQIYRNIEELIKYDSKMQRIVMLSYVTQLLFEISKLYSSGEMTNLLQYPNLKISEIINYINENLTQDLCLENISKQFFISKFYLSCLFKENTGSTIGNFTLKKRLLFAQRLINGGAMPSSACFSSGFTDYSTFYKGYKKYLGISPSKSANNPNNKLTL